MCRSTVLFAIENKCLSFLLEINCRCSDDDDDDLPLIRRDKKKFTASEIAFNGYLETNLIKANSSSSSDLINGCSSLR